MRFVKTPALAMIGLIGVGLVAVKLWTGDLGVAQAGLRVGVLTAALIVAEKFFLPLAKSLVTTGQRDR
jgi:hypothetical protein